MILEDIASGKCPGNVANGLKLNDHGDLGLWREYMSRLLVEVVPNYPSSLGPQNLSQMGNNFLAEELNTR